MNTDLLEYIKSLTDAELADFARRADTTVNYLNQPAYGNKKIGPAFALRLEAASKGKLKAHRLCSDFDWAAAARGGRCELCSANVGASLPNRN